MLILRQCRVCKINYQFHPRKRSCKDICNRCYKREWTRNHPEKSLEWARKNPQKRKEITLKYRKSHPMIYRKASKKWRENNQEKYKKVFIINNQKAKDKLIRLAGRPKPIKCEVCERIGRICFDHDHKTGKFRGWICWKCNATLGMVNDNPMLLYKLAKYLKILK